LPRVLKKGKTSYSANDVLDYLLGVEKSEDEARVAALPAGV
jgi:hypothetical protein